jgi:hypothetical protein
MRFCLMLQAAYTSGGANTHKDLTSNLTPHTS